MNVSLTPELDRFISSRVEAGEYATASEVVRDALRILKSHHDAQQLRLETLRALIKEGVDSPKVSEEDAYRLLSDRLGFEVGP